MSYKDPKHIWYKWDPKAISNLYVLNFYEQGLLRKMMDCYFLEGSFLGVVEIRDITVDILADSLFSESEVVEPLWNKKSQNVWLLCKKYLDDQMEGRSEILIKDDKKENKFVDRGWRINSEDEAKSSFGTRGASLYLISRQYLHGNVYDKDMKKALSLIDNGKLTVDSLFDMITQYREEHPTGKWGLNRLLKGLGE